MRPSVSELDAYVHLLGVVAITALDAKRREEGLSIWGRYLDVAQ
jgi:hypothetical protein